MGDAPLAGRQDNRGDVYAAADVLSPELVLVSSPEEAARARALLPEFVYPLVPRKLPPSRRARAVFEGVCLAATFGPLLLAVLTR